MNSTGLPDPAKSHVTQFDGIRGIAIALVLMVHCYGRGPDMHLSTLASGKALSSALSLGWAGVELFFVLSGLLVTSILLERKRKNQGLGPFYARRFARIVPPYFAVISMLAALSFVRLEPLIDNLTQSARQYWPYYALFVNNYFGFIGQDGGQLEKIMGPMWSIATEMQYYIIWPLIVMNVKEEKLGSLLVLALVACITLRAICILEGVSARAIYTASITHLDGMILGSFLAVHWQRLGLLNRKFWNYIFLCSAGVTFLYFSICGDTDALNPNIQVLGYTLVSLLSCFLVLMSVQNSWTKHFFNLSILQLLGKYSYFIYLVHMPVIVVLSNKIHLSGIKWWLTYYVSVTLLLLLMGSISWRMFEGPIINWNRRREALVR